MASAVEAYNEQFTEGADTDEVEVDTEKQTEDPQDRAWDTLETEVEIVDKLEEETPTKSVEDVQKELDEAKAKLENVAGTEAVIAGFEKLGEKLAGITTPAAPATPATPAAPTETTEDFIKKNKDGYFDAPLETVAKLNEQQIRTIVGPALGQISNQLSELTRGVTKRQAGTSDTGKFVMENYGAEVEQLVQSQNIDYEKATNQVTMNHMGDVVKAQVEAAVAAKGAEGAQPAGPAKNVNPPTGQRNAPPPNKNATIRITQALKTVLEKEADQRGIHFNDMVKYVKRTNPERLKGDK